MRHRRMRLGNRYRRVAALGLLIFALAALSGVGLGVGSSTFGYYYYYYTPPGPPAVLTLTPPTAINPVGTSHTVTATVEDASSNPLQGIVVRFTVTGSVSASGQCTTDANGMCTFTYAGPALPGADLISAFADTNNNGIPDAGEPTATATKSWVVPPSTPGQVTGGGQIKPAGDRVTFGFNAKSQNGLRGECNVIDGDTMRQIKCLDVTALVIAGTDAWIYGNALDKGTNTTTSYVIHVQDIGEPGIGRDTFSITTGTGYSKSGTLTSGNIQIHR